MTDTMPDEIYVAGNTIYRGNDVFHRNYDGVLLARDAWECIRYIRADLAPKDAVSVPREVLDKLMYLLDYLEGWQAKDGSSVVVEVAQDALALLKPYVKGE